jgi:hypothetical protein
MYVLEIWWYLSDSKDQVSRPIIEGRAGLKELCVRPTQILVDY